MVDLEIFTVAVRPRLGGMTEWIHQIAEGLSLRGWKVRVIGLSDEWSSEYDDVSYQAIQFPVSSPGKSFLSGLEKWWRWRSIHNHFFQWYSTLPPARIRIADSTPGMLDLVSRLSRQDSHTWSILAGGDIFKETQGTFYTPLIHRTIRKAMREAERIFVDGQDLVDSLVSQGLPPDRFRLVYHGVDFKQFLPGGNPSSFWESQPDEVRLRVSWHGRLSDGHGPLRFLEVVNQVDLIEPRMAGDGPLVEELKRRLVQQGNDRWYLGRLSESDLKRFLFSSQIGVYPLVNMAGIPRVLLESMAAGLVTLTLPTGSVNHLIQSGENGLVCRDLHEMVRMLTEVVRAPEKFLHIGESAQKTIKDRWSMDACLDSLERVLMEVGK